MFHRPADPRFMPVFVLPLLFVLCLPFQSPEAVVLGSMEQSKGHAEEQSVSLQVEGECITLPLEDYVVGVTAAEMPSDFALEALKAQAVIARTYALWKSETGTPHESGAALCTDPGHCQAYHSEEALKSLWTEDYEEKHSKIALAVAETEGQVLTYQGALAETYYHSTCGGRTASAAEVWGEEIPYLVSVECRWDSDAPRYEESVRIPLSELSSLLGSDNSSVVPAVASLTESGRSKAVTCGGITFDALDFRNALHLNSTRLDFSVEGSDLIVTTLGFGHGVGLCQYGANGLAEEGCGYRAILQHYYQNIELKKY